MQILPKREKTVSELEEEREHGEAEISVLKQKVLKRELEKRMGEGSAKYFKDDKGKTSWGKIYQWLKTH